MKTAPEGAVFIYSLDDFLGYAGKHFWMIGGEVGEDFTVERNICLLKLTDEGAVGLMTIFTHCGVQAYNPELTEVTFFITAMGEGVASCAHEAFMCLLNLGRSAMAEAFCARQYIGATFVCADSSFDSCHTKLINR